MLLRSRGVDVKAYDKVSGAPAGAKDQSSSNTNRDESHRQGLKKSKADKNTKSDVADVTADARSAETAEESVDPSPVFWTEVGAEYWVHSGRVFSFKFPRC